MWRVCVLFTGYGLIHSLLASSWSKNLVERLGGKRVCHGLYRPCFILQWLVATRGALKKFWQLAVKTYLEVNTSSMVRRKTWTSNGLVR